MSEFDELRDRKKKERELDLVTPADLVPVWAKYKTDDTGLISIGIPQIDEDKKFRYKGTVTAIVGYGGSKKSLLALNSAREAIFNSDCTAVYSSMEMSDIMKLDRILDMSINMKEKYANPSYMIEKAIKADQGRIPDLQNELDDLYKDRLLLNFKPRATAKDYEQMILKAIERTGRCDLLIVDGLSMMGGTGGFNETAQYSVNSGELKELANKYNVWIALICHCARGGTKHTRDTQQYIRGSEKVLDNVDDVICASQIIDIEESSDSYTAYRKDVGYLWYMNKRGSGNEVPVIYHFDRVSLKMSATGEDPADFEYTESKNKSRDYE